MSFSATDHGFMAQALRLAKQGRYSAAPNPHVACLMVRDGLLVGEGVHLQAGTPHAEIHAIKAAGEKARGATAYVTLEPCAHTGRTGPCADALIAAGVVRVVAAIEDPNPEVAGTGLGRCAAAGISTASGLLAAAAEREYRGFLSRMRRNRPWVTAKLAASLDGRTAMASGESKWITGPEARADVQSLRAGHDAMLTGIATVLADDPSLTVRDERFTIAEQPVRVVLDSRLRMPVAAKMLSQPGKTWVVTTRKGLKAWPDRAAELQSAGAEVFTVGDDEQVRLPLAEVMAELGRREINAVMVEAGARLNGALLADGLTDELVLFMAPHLMGSAGRGLFDIPSLMEMTDRTDLHIDDVRAVGRDWRITARPGGA